MSCVPGKGELVSIPYSQMPRVRISNKESSPPQGGERKLGVRARAEKRWRHTIGVADAATFFDSGRKNEFRQSSGVGPRP